MAQQSFDKWMDDLADHLASKISPAKGDSALPALNREWTPDAERDVCRQLIDILSNTPHNRISRILADAIPMSFMFSNTPEGVDFWNEICTKLRRGR